MRRVIVGMCLSTALATMPWWVSSAGMVPSASESGACVPAPHATNPGARCIFDIWGTVTDANGVAFAGVAVTDGNEVVETNSSGYYDLWESGPSRYTVTASYPGCQDSSAQVDDSVQADLAGDGVRQNFVLQPLSGQTCEPGNAFTLGAASGS